MINDKNGGLRIIIESQIAVALSDGSSNETYPKSQSLEIFKHSIDFPTCLAPVNNVTDRYSELARDCFPRSIG